LDHRFSQHAQGTSPLDATWNRFQLWKSFFHLGSNF